ncbi:MAG: hypothetical protein ABR947_12130 [Solirubrobacteraceae bacterium]
MSAPPPRRRGRKREPKPPSEREWETSVVVEPRRAPRHPAMISDGGGLPFPPSALDAPPAPLDPQDPAAAALIAHLAARAGARSPAPKRPSRAPWRRRASPEPQAATQQAAIPGVDGWRLLARTDSEALFGRGLPPSLLTVAVRRESPRRGWIYAGSSAARPLRAARDGIRASSWRLDPDHEPSPDDEVLRLLLTEQSFSGGQRADSRVLAPDVYIDDDTLVLTMFVTPRPGFQWGSNNPETPVKVALGEPVGLRRLIDGALVRPAHSAPGDPPPA